MSAYQCLMAKIASGKVAKHKGEAATKRIKEIEEALIRQGENPSMARQMAEARFADEFDGAKARQKWRLINRVRVMRDLQAKVDATPPAKLGSMAAEMVNQADFEARAWHKRIMAEVGTFLEKHRVNLKNTVTNPVSFKEFLKALHGEATSDASAKAMAKAVTETNEWIRKKLNSYGYSIGKLEDWGMPHSHNALTIGRTPKPEFFAAIDPLLDWAGMTNPKTGLEFGAKPPEAFRREFIDAMHDNLSYGRDSAHPSWGGKAEGNGLERHRALKFKDAESWIKYNDKYGSADPHSTLLSHWDQMSRHLALAQRFGHAPQTAIEYLGQIVAKKMRDEQAGAIIAGKAKFGVTMARNMVRVMEGGMGPSSYYGAQTARFFSSTRKILTSALLDRAVVISVPSDLNSVQLAASAIKMNPANFMTTYVGLLHDAVKGGGATRADLLRAGHIAESWANPGVTSSRFQAEFPASALAEMISNASMRIQGMNAHTDSAKLAWSWSMAGHLASISDKAFADIHPRLRAVMEKAGIDAADWDTFRTGPKFTASNGGEFLSPIYWQTATTIDPVDADRIFLKFQSFSDRFLELAVPSRSLYAQGVMDPRAWDMSPGSAPYEVINSMGMFKSFVGAFVVNQATMFRLMPTTGAKAWYAVKLLATTTAVGALGIQINEMLMGRDPQPMNGDFILRAVLRGGGLGPIGDLAFAGTTTWGGGLASYAFGPIPQLGQDVLKLTLGNVAQAYQQAMNGDDIDLDFMKELLEFQSRYTPMWQTPAAAGGAALDRLITQEMLMMLDPEGYDKLMTKETARENRYGNSSFWMPGSPLPSRGPDMANALPDWLR
jgi:hypothetical protein